MFTLADEDRAALGVEAAGKSAALPLVTPASTYMPAGKRGTGLRRDADRHLDLAAEPHRPRMVSGQGRPASRPMISRSPLPAASPADLRSPHPGVSFVGRVPDAHRVRAERPRRAADQPRRQRRAAEDHRDLRARPAGGRDVAFAARHRRRAGQLRGGRRPGRIRPRARARQPAAPAISMARASAASSFGRSTVSSRSACTRSAFRRRGRAHEHPFPPPDARRPPGRTFWAFRSPASTSKTAIAPAARLRRRRPLHQGRLPQRAQRQPRLLRSAICRGAARISSSFPTASASISRPSCSMASRSRQTSTAPISFRPFWPPSRGH